MREIRTSGSEGGGAGNSTGSSYPYHARAPSGGFGWWLPLPGGRECGWERVGVRVFGRGSAPVYVPGKVSAYGPGGSTPRDAMT